MAATSCATVIGGARVVPVTVTRGSSVRPVTATRSSIGWRGGSSLAGTSLIGWGREQTDIRNPTQPTHEDGTLSIFFFPPLEGCLLLYIFSFLFFSSPPPSLSLSLSADCLLLAPSPCSYRGTHTRGVMWVVCPVFPLRRHRHGGSQDQHSRRPMHQGRQEGQAQGWGRQGW